LTFRRDTAVGVLAVHLDLVEVDGSVETNANPPARADVGGSKDSIGGLGDEISLSTGRRGAPQMSEIVIVMTVGPEHDELFRGEEGW